MRTCRFSYNKKVVELTPNKMNLFDELYIDFKIKEEAGHQRIQLMIHVKQPIVIDFLELDFDYNFNNQKLFCNGFQSWSESREYAQTEQLENVIGLSRPLLKYFGDYHFDLPRGRGKFHSWTYGYSRNKTGIDFWGSLSEETGFTIIQYKPEQNIVTIKKDCAQLELGHSFPILDAVILSGTESEVFDNYFSLMEIPPPTAPPAFGWTSWYNYYTKISEQIILENLEAFSSRAIPIDIFQIDDGYQAHVGDWLKVKDTFPNGMAPVAQKIKGKGYKAGIWLAPFICEAKSDIFKNKKDWLLKDDNGKPLKVAYNPLWSGWFYALDFMNKEVQDYVQSVCVTMLEKWGYDMLKLDFLFAVCIKPPKDKTRGQIMSAAMKFLRRCAGNKLLLGCGVPLGPSFGQVDYCRIGADIHLNWEHRFLKMLGNRERVSTIVSLRSTLGRWQLNGRAFQNDPDVFILRDKNNKLNPAQQYTILLVNMLMGNLLFTSDAVNDYSEEQWGEFQSIFFWKGSEVQSVVQPELDRFVISFRKDGLEYRAHCNLTGKTVEIGEGKLKVALDAYESVILKGVS